MKDTEEYCPICSNDLNNITRPPSSTNTINDALFKPIVNPIAIFYCDACNVELWRYPKDNKDAIQRKGWYVHIPLSRIAEDNWAEILHNEDERKVFTLVYAHDGELNEKCSGVASDIEAIISQWVHPITSLRTSGYLPHHIENIVEHMIHDQELTDAERYSFFNHGSQYHDEAVAKVKEEALKRTREFFGINQVSNGHNDHWKIIEFNLKTGQSKEYPSDTIHGYDGEE